ncbi:MAG: ribosome-associated translation inhibitor RaiA [Ginsengibacter sp.]
MKINIRSIAFTLGKEVSDFIKNKVKKLNRFYREIISVDVSLKVEKSNTPDNKMCRIRLIIPGNDMLSGARCKTFEAATAQAVKALERQIETRKTKAVANRLIKNVGYDPSAFIF